MTTYAHLPREPPPSPRVSCPAATRRHSPPPQCPPLTPPPRATCTPRSPSHPPGGAQRADRQPGGPRGQGGPGHLPGATGLQVHQAAPDADTAGGWEPAVGACRGWWHCSRSSGTASASVEGLPAGVVVGCVEMSLGARSRRGCPGAALGGCAAHPCHACQARPHPALPCPAACSPSPPSSRGRKPGPQRRSGSARRACRPLDPS
jgi:hypothetical protein